ncbi:predicted protein [Uncinocarpus reesii 1704]|uniref:Uncharacterized protein n=1 Tax=Uncinocarpus reesii (strain UAMH 1704) TaxID=336963 RepID=C4JJ61_UNCRE|nr:uncharacterized protein UREG_01668 [Uncinocarpus reesii 1704]EEP76819.1 predicted protein [Uncinocarpus reesii 1704]
MAQAGTRLCYLVVNPAWLYAGIDQFPVSTDSLRLTTMLPANSKKAEAECVLCGALKSLCLACLMGRRNDVDGAASLPLSNIRNADSDLDARGGSRQSIEFELAIIRQKNDITGHI